MNRLRDPYFVNIALGVAVVIACLAAFIGLSVVMYLIGQAVTG